MKPIEFDGQNNVIAKDQPQYNPLPCHIDKDGTVTSCWELTPEELAIVKRTGKIWVRQMAFKKPLQPINLFAHLKFIDLNEFEGEEHY